MIFTYFTYIARVFAVWLFVCTFSNWFFDAELKETTLGFIFITMKRFQNLSIYIDLKKGDQILKSILYE